jgi:peptidoglycan lytic transglycosylase
MGSRLLGLLLLSVCFGAPVVAHDSASHRAHEAREAPHHVTSHASASKPLGKKQKGKASYYARSFAGKKMADGTRLNPASNAAASKTLPLGTKAKVTNLDNGKVAVVEIRDRGPFVKGRIVDVTPGTAAQLGMKEDGVVPVEVQPIAPPPAEEDKPKGQGRRGQ